MGVSRGGTAMTALEQLGAYVAGSGRAPVPDDLRQLLALHVVDTIGAWIAGAQTSEGAALLAFRTRMQADAQPGGSLALDLATRCALARLSEIDDIHLASMTTPGAIVIPGALSLAAAMPAATADDAVAAMLSGYEVMTRLGRAIDGPQVLYRGIWPTYFAAPFGIAAVAARLLGLDARAAAHALALALTFAAPGVGHHNAATTARWLAIGNATRNGLVAALAAQSGFTSDLTLLDGNFLPGIYGVTPDAAALIGGLGEHSALREISFKPWCAARQTMAATQALREIVEGGIAPDAIAGVTAYVLPPHLKMIDHGVVAGDRATHLTSAPYCMAVAALAPDMAFDPGASPPDVPAPVRAFMDRIAVEADENLLADYPRTWPARVRVIANGVQHERRVTHVPGDPARAFDRSAMQAKFLRFTGLALGSKVAEHILARCADAMTGNLASLIAEVEQACQEVS